LIPFGWFALVFLVVPIGVLAFLGVVSWLDEVPFFFTSLSPFKGMFVIILSFARFHLQLICITIGAQVLVNS